MADDGSNNQSNRQAPFREDAPTAWVWVALCVLIIYVTIPLARAIQEFVRDHGASALFLWTTYIAFGIGAVGALVAIRRAKVRLALWRAVLLAAILGLFSYLAWTLRANPEEALHFVQYGVLSLLLFRAFRHHVASPMVYFTAAMTGSLFGVIDEIIQWITPRRFFDFRDIGINVLAVCLVQLALAYAIRPRAAGRPESTAGRRIAFGTLAGSLLLIVLCLNVTPAAIQSAREKGDVPKWLSQPLAEYGYLYRDAEIGWFKSRLSPEELARVDREDYEAVVREVDDVRQDRLYGWYLGNRPAHRFPFRHEIRVHFFRRDRYMKEALGTDDPLVRREKATVAWYENRILEKYFPNTLNHSRYLLNDWRREFLDEHADHHNRYRSAVSKGLITLASRETLTISLALLTAVSLVLAFRSGKRGSP